MKKYLMFAAATLALASCNKMDDVSMSRAQLDRTNYDQAFLNYVGGSIASNQTWGFSANAYTRAAITRAAGDGMPSAPTFSSKSTDIDPKRPTDPTPSKTFYNTLAAAQAATTVTYSGSVADDNAWNSISNATIYIDSSNFKVGSNSQNMTIIVNDNMSFDASNLNTNGNGPIICVAEGKTLTLTGIKQGVTIYLAPTANLDMRQISGTATLSKCDLIMSSGNTVNAGALKVEYCSIVNKGGTFNASSIQLDNSSNLWNEGTVSVSGALNTANQNVNIYNANNASITAVSMALNQKVTLWNEGTVNLKNADGTYTATNKLEGVNTNVIIYNAGGKTIEVGAIELKSSAPEILYNDGTVTCHGEISLDNSADEVINNGTLTATALNMKAGGKMYNTATTNISGQTKISNANCEWQNDGQYTSGSFEVDQYAVKNYNNCKLTVTGNFFLNRGKFVLNGGIDGGASLVCNSFTFEDTSNFYMGGNSMLKVANALTTNNYNSGYGFRGVGSDYAVIKAGTIAKGGSDVQYSMTYFGNLFVDAGSHFAQGYIDTGYGQPYYAFDNTVRFSFNEAGVNGHGGHSVYDGNVTIPSSTCTDGYSYTPDDTTTEDPGTEDPTDDPTPTPLTEKIRIIAEDLSATGSSDFDFNDVVLDVTFGSPATIVLQAAGGTLPLRINGRDDLEVHKLFGEWVGETGTIDENTPLQKMINTGAGPSKAAVDISTQVNVNIADAAEANTKLKLEVFKNGTWQEMESPRAEPACKLAVGDDFVILPERQSIKGEYPLFLEWVTDANFTSKWW